MPTEKRDRLANLKPFPKGKSANPGGRPKTPEVFKQHSAEAFAKVLQLMNGRDAKVALQAATLILAYAFGKPRESMEVQVTVDIAQTIREARERIDLLSAASN